MFIHYMYVAILFPLTKAIPIMFEHITKLYKHGQAMVQRVIITSTRYLTRYLTFSSSLTWLGYNATCYHNFNMLPHALPYISSEFCMVWELFAMHYHALPSDLQKNISQYFLKKITVTRGNALQITQNQANLRKNIQSRVEAMVTRYIKAYPCLQSLIMYGNKFKMTKIEVTEGYGNFSNMAYPCFQSLKSCHVIPVSARFSKSSHLLLWNSLKN